MRGVQGATGNTFSRTVEATMGLFNNLARIVAAPIEIIDATVVKPLADLADDVAEGFKD